MSRKSRPAAPPQQPPRAPSPEPRKDEPTPDTGNERQPDEVPEKQYAKREESRSRQYEQEQKSRSSDHRDPGHDYEHHAARIRDQR